MMKSISLCCRLALACVYAPAALAHATLEAKEAPAGALHKAVVKVPHGCKGSATTAVRVKIPAGLVNVKPMPKPGWQLDTVKGPYAAPQKGYKGKEVTEGVLEIVWSGGRLLDEHYDEFVFQALVSEGAAPGTTLAVPVTQTCEIGEVAWVEVAAPGSEAQALAFPAPLLRIVAGPAKAPAAIAIKTANGLVIETPWTRASPKGAVAAGAFVRISNSGTAPDRLVSATLTGGARTELHATTQVDGVMRMRQVEGGIDIAPGATVELKPGSLHIMLVGLDKPLEAGGVVEGTLTFEKAGAVAVKFPVASAGSLDPPKAAGEHSHH
jgi:uncharacterized protein YcnI/copper(I)-binding protein